MKRIRLLHIYNDFNEFNGLLGTLIILAREIDYKRFDFAVCVFNAGEEKHGRQLRKYGAKLFSLNVLPGWKHAPGTFLRLYRFLRDYKPDIVQTYCIKANFIGIMAAKMSGVPVIIGTELTMKDLARSGVRRIKHRIVHPFMNIAINSCDKFIVNSKAVQREWIQESQKTKCLILHDPFDVENCKAAITSYKKKRGVEGRTIGFVGRLVECKGLFDLLEAMLKIREWIPNAELMIVGSGPLEGELKKWTRDKNLEDQVQFLGFQANVFKCLLQMDILVLPSRTEGMGKAILEGMAVGIPVVATNVGGIPEVVLDGETGVLVRYNDSRELSSVISDLLLDRERAREMGRKGRARVFDVFDPLLYINGLQDIYGRLFKEKVL